MTDPSLADLNIHSRLRQPSLAAIPICDLAKRDSKVSSRLEPLLRDSYDSPFSRGGEAFELDGLPGPKRGDKDSERERCFALRPQPRQETRTKRAHETRSAQSFASVPMQPRRKSEHSRDRPYLESELDRYLVALTFVNDPPLLCPNDLRLCQRMHDLDDVLHIDHSTSSLRIVPVVDSQPAIGVLAFVLRRTTEFVLQSLGCFGQDLRRVRVVLNGVDEGERRGTAEGEGRDKTELAGTRRRGQATPIPVSSVDERSKEEC